MSKFLSRLDVELVSDTQDDGRSVWELKSPLLYQSSLLNVVFAVPSGFLTDFASVPRIPLVFDFFGDTCHEAATVHDYLYFTKAYDRPTADAVLLEAMKVTNTPVWRRQLIYAAVRIFGASRFNNR